MPAIEIQDLHFRYPGQVSPCLNNIHLRVEQGESFGLLGPNGAGKSTLISLMTGLLKSSSGTLSVLGKDVSKSNSFRKYIGFVPQEFAFYETLSPLENLQFFGAWAGLRSREIQSRSAEILHILGLTEYEKIAVRKFSGGMKRRVNLAIGVINQPRILFLDEPTVGVDVQTRHAIIHYLKELNQRGTTLVYTSHLLAEAEVLCDQVALIDEGRILVHNTLGKLVDHHEESGLEGLFLKLTGKAYRD